ncbi:MAG: hypothetical protein QNK35_08220, partial [Bacteroides sp.]|nr:hypothetical protein [Bacteroides sp.]
EGTSVRLRDIPLSRLTVCFASAKASTGEYPSAGSLAALSLRLAKASAVQYPFAASHVLGAGGQDELKA